MKFAFSTLACPQWSNEDVVKNAVQMGFNGIEWRLIDGEVIDPVSDADKLREAVDLCLTHGLDVCALDTSCRFNHPDAQERARNVTELQHWISLAQELQAPILRVFGGAIADNIQPQPGIEEQVAWVAESLRQVAQQAEVAKVTIALETHDAFSSAHRVAQVLDQVASPAIAALWDSHHPFRVGESVDEVLSTLGDRIAHVHVKDAFQIPDSGKWQLVLLGEGIVPIQEQLQRLHEHGYHGYVSVEWEKRWHLELSNPEIALPEHIAWLKRLETALPNA